MRSISIIVLLFLMALTMSLSHCESNINITSVSRPSTERINKNYTGNRPPLLPLSFIKLPVSSVKPKGWILNCLELQRNGLLGNLGEISAWLDKKDNAWLSKDGSGDHGWEEVPYWLRGYGNMGYILGDDKIISEAEIWINSVLKNQRTDGYFGKLNIDKQGRYEIWANMLMLQCLQSYYEFTNDKRVLLAMSNYFKWQMAVPEEKFLKNYWENSRGGDNLASVHWLYNITGESWLLQLAEKIHRNTANWRQQAALPNWHNVNIAQGFREPASWWMQSKDSSDLNATYNNFDLVRRLYGQVPGGMFGADENARPGYSDPRQGVETCGMVEQMASDVMLLRITGDPFWAENCEDVAFNTFPAAFMPDFKSLRYFTCPNLVVSDDKDHNPGIQNIGPQLLMSSFSSKCCQHNHGMGWPYFIENMWMATPDDGLVAMLYGSNEVSAKVGDGAEVVIKEKTNYPFEEKVSFEIELKKETRFPIYFRIPSWCEKPVIALNGKILDAKSESGNYVRIETSWKDKDRIEVIFPMTLKIRIWKTNQNSASLNYGPLTFSLKIGEDYVKQEGAKSVASDSRWQSGADQSKWPAYQIFPTTPWNYGLVFDINNLKGSFSVIKTHLAENAYPFTANEVPIQIKAKGRRIPSWTLDQYGLCAVLPTYPVETDLPEEDIILIPMGAARLRISAFPQIQNR